MKRYALEVTIAADGQPYTELRPAEDGCVVLYADHEAETQKLRDSIGDLHALIEEHWTNQCSRHACGCGEWPECTHTLIAAEMRRRAMALEEGTE
jgi:hypothetical protein